MTENILFSIKGFTILENKNCEDKKCWITDYFEGRS